ncbi:MAG: DegT/DnrJ/EryC1/StrS family aminotransferase, partial [Bdellovibrionales bacterium]|nr:DegT/DnrJ/EryC1/StrS family aminotransferase [Bdellovibrionales bacterium]
SIATFYSEELMPLMEMGKVILPPSVKLRDEDGYFDTYQNYEVEVEERERLRQFLGSKGIGTSLPWGGSAVHQFEGLGFLDPSAPTKLPYTEGIFQRCLLLPMNQFVSSDDANYIVECIKEFYNAA